MREQQGLEWLDKKLSRLEKKLLEKFGIKARLVYQVDSSKEKNGVELVYDKTE